jgi:hypothetical protein
VAEDKKLDWQVPRFEMPAGDRFSWVEEQIQEGEGWLSGQTAYKNLSNNLLIFDAVVSDKIKSTLVSNGLKYDLRKFVETISEVSEIAKYGSDAQQFKPFAEMVNKVAKGLYLESQFPRSIRKALQFALLGRGYIWPKCKTGEYGYGERKIVFEPLGILDVVPVQVPSSGDVQEAYANTIYVYMPIAEAHGRFPLFQSSLVPVSAVTYQSRVAARRADFAEKYRYGDQARNWGNLYCEIRYTFIRDIRINNTQSPMPMGDWSGGSPVTSWSYEVPYVGQEIFGGIRNGQPYMRPAQIEDCRVYPFLRLIITSPGMEEPMYDGPAYDWHGMMPAVQYDLDDWAWETMGRSIIQDVGSIEITKRKLERKMDSVITTTLNPPMGYNRGEAGGPKIENFDIFEEDVRYGVDGEPKKTLQSLLPEEVRVIAEHFKFLEMLAAARKEQLGINDLGNLANMKLNLSGDTLDKALEPVGPIAKGIAAGMEAANAKIAYMLKFSIPQWYDTKRIIEYVGPDNITPEVFDFDPASMVPSHMPDEYMDGNVPTTPSAYKPIDRMRRLAKNMRLISVPSTLIKMTQQAEQLKWMSLKFKNAPISWSTTLTKIGIDNYGEVKGSTEREKWINEQIEDLKLKAIAAKLAMELGLTEPGEGGGKPGGGKGGRPPSGKKPMKQAMKGGKGGEPRVVNKES